MSDFRNSGAAAISAAVAASGTITYTVNFNANDTVTLNGVVFTAVAANAAGNQFNIGVDLSTSLSNLVGALNASLDLSVAKATYAKSGTTILQITYDLVGTVGNSFTIAGSVGTASGLVLAGGINGVLNIAVLRLGAHILATVASSGKFVLPDGVEGLETTLMFGTKAGSVNATITGTYAGGTTLTFDTVGKLARLIWLSGAWRVIVNTGSIA